MIEGNMNDEGIIVTSKATQLYYSLVDHPESDDTKLCDDYQTKFYQNLLKIQKIVCGNRKD